MVLAETMWHSPLGKMEFIKGRIYKGVGRILGRTRASYMLLYLHYSGASNSREIVTNSRSEVAKGSSTENRKERGRISMYMAPSRNCNLLLSIRQPHVFQQRGS